MKNKMKEVANLLGVELGEEFKIVGCSGKFCFTLEGLYKGKDYASHLLRDLIVGERQIEKLPFKPKEGEVYFTVYTDINYGLYVSKCCFDKCSGDYIRHKQGLVFRTEKEAREIGIPIVEAIIKEYEND